MVTVLFHPKFNKGQVRSIYYRRLLKKAARVGAEESLVRRLETLVAFDDWEGLVGSREIEADLSALPDVLRNADAPEMEKVFLALCYDSSLELDWPLYFGNAEETSSALAEELELCE